MSRCSHYPGTNDRCLRCEVDALRAALAAAEAKLAEWKNGAVNDACGDALELLWRDVMLASKPDYGPWEYPGHAYRHLLAEFNALKAALADERRHALVTLHALAGCVEWMGEDGCDCGSDDPRCALCEAQAVIEKCAARRAAEVANG